MVVTDEARSVFLEKGSVMPESHYGEALVNVWSTIIPETPSLGL